MNITIEVAVTALLVITLLFPVVPQVVAVVADAPASTNSFLVEGLTLELITVALSEEEVPPITGYPLSSFLSTPFDVCAMF